MTTKLPPVGKLDYEEQDREDEEPAGFYYSSEDDEKWSEPHPLINVFSCGWYEGELFTSFV